MKAKTLKKIADDEQLQIRNRAIQELKERITERLIRFGCEPDKIHCRNEKFGIVYSAILDDRLVKFMVNVSVRNKYSDSYSSIQLDRGMCTKCINTAKKINAQNALVFMVYEDGKVRKIDLLKDAYSSDYAIAPRQTIGYCNEYVKKQVRLYDGILMNDMSVDADFVYRGIKAKPIETSKALF